MARTIATAHLLAPKASPTFASWGTGPNRKRLSSMQTRTECSHLASDACGCDFCVCLQVIPVEVESASRGFLCFQLGVNRGDDPSKAAQAFCEKHQLGPE